MTVPKIQTYHCHCTNLLLASTHNLTSLPHRSSPALDKALILPLPSPPRPHSTTTTTTSEDSEDSLDSDSAASENEGVSSKRDSSRKKKSRRAKDEGLGYSLILAMTLDRKPVVVRREDGFEKRVLWRCGRCRLVVGYQLDEVHYKTTTGVAVRKEGDGIEGVGRVKVVYLLPGSLLTTEEMRAGKVLGKEEIELVEE
ncbi:MAG: hypothetical protein M1812_007582 [Candelaria pacifica]|nr:MAG: hypothetical protein M1812_007582 [Candelaria pacifica]